MLAALCLPVALGGCSFVRSPSTTSKIPKGAPGQIGTVVNDLSSDATASGGASTICSSVLSSALEAQLNKVGGCTKVIENQLDTVDDDSLTIESVTWSSHTATAEVKTVVNGKHQLQTLDLIDQKKGGWRISSLG
jgi:hypothetical protein